MAGNIGDNVMRARYRGFNAPRGGSRFFVTESAAVSDRRHARRNFQFPNLLNWAAKPQISNFRECYLVVLQCDNFGS